MTSDDRTLQQRVMDELAFDPMVPAASIGVVANNGIVTLTGYVDSYAAKTAAAHAARRVRGAKAVADEIEVRLSTEKKTADHEIAARAVKLLEWDALVPAGAVRVEVEHGVVTLSGEVDWAFQRDEAERDMLKLGGVKLVVNDIAVRPTTRPEDVRGVITAAFERAAEHEAAAITVDVDGSRVILGGEVQSWVEREQALRAAWSVPGVTMVEEHIRITRP
jgi:osmotically-inducible protein OsmY